MDDLDNTYLERQHFFQQGAQQGKIQALNQDLPDVVEEAHTFGQEFAQEIGTYEAYIEMFDEVGISQRLPLLKVNDIVSEMKALLGSLNFGSLTQLKLQREVLRKKYQLFKAMTAIKQEDFSKANAGLDF